MPCVRALNVPAPPGTDRRRVTFTGALAGHSPASKFLAVSRSRTRRQGGPDVVRQRTEPVEFVMFTACQPKIPECYQTDRNPTSLYSPLLA
jgi:hypothetical protein